MLSKSKRRVLPLPRHNSLLSQLYNGGCFRSTDNATLDLAAWERRTIERYPVGRKEVISVEKSRER